MVGSKWVIEQMYKRLVLDAEDPREFELEGEKLNIELGICYFMRRLTSCREYKQYFRTWEYYSGVAAYPLGINEFSNPILWVGKSLELRKDLITHIYREMTGVDWRVG